MLEANNLVKSFNGLRALDGLDLNVPQGAVYGLVGPNGAGKSTLIRHLTGIYRQDGGEVLLDGAPIYENPAAKARIGYIPDEIFYYTQATIRDMKRLAKSMYPRFDEARFEALRPLFGLDERKLMRTLSRGMQKQAAFWITLSQRPELLILDEPMDGLDPVIRRQIWSVLMEDVAESGMTVLVSSHNLRELEDVCDRVGILRGGKMLLERSLSELQEGLVKVQLAYAEGGVLPEGLDILHQSAKERLQQLILRGNREELQARLAATDPIFMELLPLTLEEIFIYELGGTAHEIQDVLV